VGLAVDAGVDAICARARAVGAIIVTEPYDTPYASREFSCRDPEGHVWNVGRYRGEVLSG